MSAALALLALAAGAAAGAPDQPWAALFAGDAAPLTHAWEQDPADLDSAVGIAALLEARGDTDGALAVLVRALDAGDQTGAVAAAALSHALALATRASDGGVQLLGLLERIASGDRPAPGAEAASLARLGRVGILFRSGDAERALSVVRKETGLVTRWRLLGPYGAFDRLDLDRPFPPESGELATPQAEGPRPPRAVDARFADGIVTLPDGLIGSGVAYAAADLRLETARALRVRVRSEGSFALTIDGVTVLRADRWRERPPIALAARVPLAAGRHRLLVKLPASEPPRSFSLQLERPDGTGPLQPLEISLPDDQAQLAGLAGKVTPLPSPFDADAAGADPRDRPAAALAGYWWLLGRRLERPAGRLLERLLEAWPESGLLRLWHGEYLARAETGASPQADIAESRVELERALDADPALAGARLLAAELDLGAGRLPAAQRAVDAVLADLPEQPDALELAHRIALRRGFVAEAARAIDRAVREAPARQDLLQAAYALAKRRGAHARAFALSEALARRGLAVEERARALAARGRLEEALALLDAREAGWPAELGPRLARGMLLADAGRFDEALSEAHRAALAFPGIAAARLAEASLLDRLGRSDGALARIREALALSPGRLDLRELLTRRGEPERLTRYLADPREILARAPPVGSADSALLADIAVVEIDAQGGQTELYQGIHAVYSRAGVEKEGELEILPGARVEWIRIHKPDGRVVDVDAGTRRPVSLPGLEPGDAVEYVWWRYLPPLSGLPGALDNSTYFVFQGPDRSYVLSRYVVAHDERLDVRTCGNELGLEFGERHENGFRIRSWTAREMPRQSIEPHVADRMEVTPHIRLGMGLDWRLLGDSLRNALVGMLRLDPPLDEMLAEIERRAGGGGPEAVARALHAVVLERMRPGEASLSPSIPASMSASAGEGNRLLVAAALARALRLPARLVLARPLEQRGRGLDCPGPDLFGYPLLELTLPDRTVFLDYNGVDFGFDMLEPRLAGGDALFIPIDGEREAEVGPLPARAPVLLREDRAELRLDADGTVAGTIGIEFRESLAAHTRALLRGVPRDRMAEVYQALAGDIFPGAAVAGASTAGADDPESPLRVELEITGGGWPRRTPTGFALPVALDPLNLLQEYARLKSRRQPLLIDTPAVQREEIHLAVDVALLPATLPAPVRADTRFGSYALSVSRAPEGLLIVREIRLPAQRIEPADYADFRRFALLIDQAERTELPLEVTSPSLAP